MKYCLSEYRFFWCTVILDWGHAHRGHGRTRHSFCLIVVRNGMGVFLQVFPSAFWLSSLIIVITSWIMWNQTDLPKFRQSINNSMKINKTLDYPKMKGVLGMIRSHENIDHNLLSNNWRVCYERKKLLKKHQKFLSGPVVKRQGGMASQWHRNV